MEPIYTHHWTVEVNVLIICLNKKRGVSFLLSQHQFYTWIVQMYIASEQKIKVLKFIKLLSNNSIFFSVLQNQRQNKIDFSPTKRDYGLIKFKQILKCEISQTKGLL